MEIKEKLDRITKELDAQQLNTNPTNSKNIELFGKMYSIEKPVENIEFKSE